MSLQKSTLLKENQLSNVSKIQVNDINIATGKSLTQKHARSMFTMSYKLVPDWYLKTKRGNGNVALGNFTLQDGRTQTNRTVKNIPPESYYLRKCEVIWTRTRSQHSD